MSCPGRGIVGAPGGAASGWAVSLTWGCPTPVRHAQSCHVARGSPCLLARPLPSWPPPPPACFWSCPLPACLCDQYLQKGCDVSLALAAISVTDAQYPYLLSPAGVVADTGWSAVLSGLMNQSSASCDDKGLWKVQVCVSNACRPVLCPRR